MRRALLAVAVAIGVLTLPVAASEAQASYHLSKREAQKLARWDARNRYGGSHVAAYCRPQWRDAAEPGYIYHRWTCGWAGGFDGEVCGGQLIIIGSRGWDSYYSKVAQRFRCGLR